MDRGSDFGKNILELAEERCPPRGRVVGSAIGGRDWKTHGRRCSKGAAVMYVLRKRLRKYAYREIKYVNIYR